MSASAHEFDDLAREAEEILGSYEIEQLRQAGLFPLQGDYFPAIFYPPIPACPPGTEEEMFAGVPDDDARPLSFYVHIPFCPTKCVYCHWTVHTGQPYDQMARYVRAVGRELEIYKARIGRATLRPRSILVGGGTPTMLTADLVDELFRVIQTHLDLSECSQIIVEAEPGTVLSDDGMDRLRAYRKHGARRISFGAQVLDDQVLKTMGRRHTAEEARRAVDRAREAGFESISLDLIYGHPGCTYDTWVATLRKALALDIDATQVYRLRIVPHGDKPGAIGKLHIKRPEQFADFREIFLMKQVGILYCREQGYVETTRRVFTRDARHNSDYLVDHNDRLADVLGVGISAWSNIRGHLAINTSESLEAYYRPLEEGKLPINRGKVRSTDDTYRWALALPLKHHGVHKPFYRTVTGSLPEEVFGAKIERLERYGLLEQTDEVLQLTQKGKFFADEVVIQFYHPDFIPFPKESYADGELNPYRP